MSEFHPSNIALNWYGDGPESEGYGPCMNCGHRDCDLFYKPFFGYWTGEKIDSEVLLLGEAPGGNSDGGRSKKNASDERNELDSVESDWFTRESKRSLTNIADPSDNGFQLPQDFIEDLLSKDIHTYYTNVKKCNDIHSDNGEQTYESARANCNTYLFEELEAVDPSVVVVFSSKTQGKGASHNLEYCFEQFGLQSVLEKKEKLESVIPEKENPDSMFPAYEADLGFAVIPAFHFTRTGGHTGQRAEFDPVDIGRPEKSYSTKWKDRYYDELSDRIAELV